jgi:hypothetical protein
VVLPSGGGCRVAVNNGKRRERADKTRDKTVLRQVAGNGPPELRSRSRATRSPFPCDKIPVPARDKLTLIPPIVSELQSMPSSLSSLMGALRLAPHHILALASGLTIAATALLFFILDYSSYGACMLAGYAAIILVHAFYLTDYAAAWPRAPYFSNEKTRSTYFGAVKYAFYGACSLGPFLMDKEFPGLPILVARSAVKACGPYTVQKFAFT